MVQEPYFTLPVVVGITPVVTTLAVSSPMAAASGDSEPVL